MGGMKNAHVPIVSRVSLQLLQDLSQRTFSWHLLELDDWSSAREVRLGLLDSTPRLFDFSL